jgi:hypothetical protein
MPHSDSEHPATHQAQKSEPHPFQSADPGTAQPARSTQSQPSCSQDSTFLILTMHLTGRIASGLFALTGGFDALVATYAHRQSSTLNFISS